MKTELYVAWVCDPVAPLFSVGLQMEAPDALARLGDRVRQAEAVLRSWVLGVRGRTLASLAMQGAFVAPAAEIHDLGRVIDELCAYVGFDYHFGIGTDLREAYYALAAAQRDQKPYVFFTEACLESELSADDGGGDLGEKLGPVDGPQDERHKPKEFKKGEELNPVQVPVEPQGGDVEPDFGADARALIVKALQGVKDQAGALQGLPPETQAAIQTCLQAMVTMAHWLRGDPMEKHEALYKRLGLPAPKQLKTVVKPEQKFPDAPGPSAMAGTIKDGKIKGTSTEGKTKWHGARAGAVMGPTGVAVSSREPQAK